MKRTEEMISHGVDILDIGGYSSRPGAEHIPEELERERVCEAIESIRSEFDVLISIDTFRSTVAEAALNSGADIINDISAGQLDSEMFSLLEKRKVPYIMMHMRGTPQTMRELTDYDNLIIEMVDYFQKRILQLKERGVNDIIIDPGFGQQYQ